LGEKKLDTTIILWTGIGAAALVFAFIDYRLSFKKRMKLEKSSKATER